MAVVAGIDGSVTFSSGYAVKVQSWTVSVEADAVDTTGWDDYDGTDAAGRLADWDTSVGGRKRWSGSFTCVFDAATAAWSTSTPLGGTASAATANFIVDRTTATDGELTGSIIVTGVEASNEVGGVASITFTFQGTGTLTTTASSA